ncbi:prepilin-type N-terminal cleavage/methylation domain-containing protein [Scandinavium sp. NPDC088450]|uniref:prepilin-type N-terminal cleavage/methylation domain-containing protein n=1 Tax=Scandinavium sp. NPDC088450 TaxID=3364514 RepID=UPI00384EF8DE
MNNAINAIKRKVNQYQEIKKQRGVTLLEIIIVLGIVGIIAAGVIILANRAFTAQDISELVDNTNSVRVGTTEAYKDSAEYPATVDATPLTKANVSTLANDSIISALVKMGKISADEAFNGMSNDAFEIGGVKYATADSKMKGFYIVINGLDTEDCRNIASQIGSQWDYVASGVAAAGAALGATGAPGQLSGDASDSILKTLTADNLNPASIVKTGFCDNSTSAGSDNALILGSK